jgi:hypothetical protein
MLKAVPRSAKMIRVERTRRRRMPPFLWFESSPLELLDFNLHRTIDQTARGALSDSAKVRLMLHHPCLMGNPNRDQIHMRSEEFRRPLKMGSPMS